MTHLRRYAAPVTFRIPVKEKKWAPVPSPGPHPKEYSVPILVVIRDWLGRASTAREAETIVKSGKIAVDGRTVREPRFPVGLMDVLTFPETGENYRVLPLYRKGLGLLEIDGRESGFKLGLIVRKQHVKGGALQFTLHDGRNVLLKDPTERERSIMTHDVFKVELPSGKVLAHLKFSPGKYGLIFRGSRSGLHGPILSYEEVRRYPAKQLVTVQTSEGTISTVLDYVMPVGEGEPWLKLP
ncbi:MAG: 30S ribosomal protein S4e [Thaumarchaeota archaeon]|nr:30S ribosomal protein S4e [Candidatus Calditenuaceae archaeon]MDW8043089.1 30S ribosomal protein S4e [Nitrososphaerota archaeon]